MRAPLLFIILIAFVLRIYQLDTHISAAYGDEVAIAYNAYSILQTDRDEFGVWFPLQFESWGDQKNPVYIYLVSVFQIFFGMNLWSVRLPSVLAGVLAVYLTYLTSYKLFHLTNLTKYAIPVGLVSAALLCINPWHLHISRGGYEANLALTLGLLVLNYFLDFLQHGRLHLRQYFAICLFSILGIYTYYTTKMFLPLFLLLLIVWGYILVRSQTKFLRIRYFRNTFNLLITVFVFSLPFIFLALFYNGQSRFNSINIFSHPDVSNRVIEERSFWRGPNWLGELVTNKATIWARDLQYYFFDNLNPVYLYSQGDSTLRYTIGNHGVFYPIEFPFLLLGLAALFSHHKKLWLLLIAWWLIAILPTSLVGKAYSLRSLAVLPVPLIFTSFGIVWLYYYLHQHLSRISARLFAGSFCLLFAVYISYFALRYAYAYPTYAYYWYDGMIKDMLDHAKSREHEFDQIYITRHYGKTELYYAFYRQVSPAQYQSLSQSTEPTQIGKYVFTDTNTQRDFKGSTLILAAPNSSEGTAFLAQDDGRILFRIVEK